MRLTDEQVAERSTFIGASEVPIIAGVSPYKTSEHDLFISKCFPPPAEEDEDEENPWESDKGEEDTEEQEMGHELEPIALRMLAKKKGLVLVPCPESRRHPQHSFIAATPDALVLKGTGDPALCALAEAKAPGHHLWHHWGENGDPNGIPEYVAVQNEMQCTVWNVPLVHVVGIFGNSIRLYEYLHNEDLSKALVELCVAWWTKHVIGREPPPLDGSKGADRTLKALYPRNIGIIRRAGPEAEAFAQAYFETKRRLAEVKVEHEKAKQGLQALIQDSDGIVGDGWRGLWQVDRAGKVSWKSVALSLGADEKSPLVAAHRGTPARKFDCKPWKGSRE